MFYITKFPRFCIEIDWPEGYVCRRNVQPLIVSRKNGVNNFIFYLSLYLHRHFTSKALSADLKYKKNFFMNHKKCLVPQ